MGYYWRLLSRRNNVIQFVIQEDCFDSKMAKGEIGDRETHYKDTLIGQAKDEEGLS